MTSLQVYFTFCAAMRGTIQVGRKFLAQMKLFLLLLLPSRLKQGDVK